VQICHFHHRLVHEGGFCVHPGPQNDFVFTRPDGRVVEPVPKNDSMQSIDGVSIETLNRACGLDIDATTGKTRWDGTDMDYYMAVDNLLARDGALELGPGARYPDRFPPKR